MISNATLCDLKPNNKPNNKNFRWLQYNYGWLFCHYKVNCWTVMSCKRYSMNSRKIHLIYRGTYKNYMVTIFIVPPKVLPKKGFKKKLNAFTKKNLLRQEGFIL